MSEDKSAPPEKPWITRLRKIVEEKTKNTTQRLESRDDITIPFLVDEMMKMNSAMADACIELLSTESIDRVDLNDLTVDLGLNQIVISDGEGPGDEDDCEDDFIEDDVFMKSLFNTPEPVKLFGDPGVCKSDILLKIGEKQTKIVTLDVQDFIGFPKPMSVDQPCKQCSRPNETTASKCWWCETENPVKY